MKQNQSKKKKGAIALGVILLAVALGFGIYKEKGKAERTISYPTFIQWVQAHEVEQVTLGTGSSLSFQVKDDPKVYRTDNPRKEGLKEELLLQGIEVKEGAETLSILQYLMSTVLMGVMFFAIYQAVKKGKSGRDQQMALHNAMVPADKLKMGFNHIAGNVEAKEQIKDVIDFMKTPDKYTKLGAKMPKGIILYGPPGTGKTLMAKAIAKESGVPFFSVSGSDFVQLYVGVGASRVRELFKEARKHEKAVIFIDEIDAIGKKRSQGVMQGNDEKDQTLNALLTEMSGFKDGDGIIVIAATNRLDTLDEALLRPGRFDRQIEIGYPDIRAREEIIKLYFKSRPVSEAVKSSEWAKQTVYFTGAMLENLINEAAIEAANRGCDCIDNDHLEVAFYTVIAGKEKKDRSMISEMDRKITAYHEAGHALITKLLLPENNIAKVTIIPSTKGAGGFSMNIPKDKLYLTKGELIAQIKVSLGGRAAEELIFGKEHITTGASNDIEKATKALRQLQLKYGMDDEMGLINLSVLTGEAHFNDPAWIEKSCKQMQVFYEETKRLLLESQPILCQLAEALLERETLNEREIASFF